MDQHDPAAARFWTLHLLRISGAALTGFGALILAGKVDWPHALGVVLFVLGAVEFFALPHVLSKRWKSSE